MLDIKYIRENPELVRTAIQQKNVALDLEQLLQADQVVTEIKKKIQSLNEEKNVNAKKTPKAAPEERASLIARGRELNDAISALTPELNTAENELQKLLLLTPNIPAPDAPIGPDATHNVVVKQWGEIPKFNFAPKDHVALLIQREWADFERIAKVSGSRMYCLKGEAVRLEWALLQFALDKLVAKKFTLLTVPSLVKESALIGTGHFPTARDQTYFVDEDDIYLSGTAEVPVNSLHANEILDEKTLPILYGAFSPCFRREAGSAGRDVRGLIRVHQFQKVEQFVICQNDPAISAHWHTELLQTAEEIVQALELPYQIIECCTGDMGAGKVKMHDIESWVPSEAKYRETHSCSTLHDWQARRTNLRYRDEERKVKFCHTLNNTALATPRVLVPFLENHQTSDGRIKIPRALKPYLNNRDFI